MTVRVGDPDTSIDAARLVQRNLKPMQMAVLDLLHTPRTSFQIANRLGKQQNSVSKRISELKDLGLVYDTGQRRRGSSAAPLTVWWVTERGRRLIGAFGA